MSSDNQRQAVLEEIEGQLNDIRREESDAACELFRIRGKRDSLVHLRGRILNNMVPGLEAEVTA